MSPRERISTISIFIVAISAALILRTSVETTIQNVPVVDATAYAEISTASVQLFSTPATQETTTKKSNVPILVYHVVRPAYPSDSRAIRDIAQTPEVFAEQMAYLKTAGYHVVSFSALEAALKQGSPLPKKPIILSFDDGWRDQLTYALPILEKNNYQATFFVFTNAIGRKGFLGWSDLQQLIKAGMTIGDHSRSHPYLNKMKSEATLWQEIYDSKILLEKNLGITINEFAYPFGQYTPAVVTMVERAGYKSARGDFYSGDQSLDRLFELSAMNVPTTTELFMRKFP